MKIGDRSSGKLIFQPTIYRKQQNYTFMITLDYATFFCSVALLMGILVITFNFVHLLSMRAMKAGIYSTGKREVGSSLKNAFNITAASR